MDNNERRQRIILFNQGDLGAFEAIFAEFSPTVYKCAKHFLGTNEEAEDIQSDTFMKLWNRRGHFDTMEKIAAFLQVTAKNASIDRLRHLNMESERKDDLVQAMSKLYEESKMTDPETEWLLERIYEELKKLPPNSLDILKLAFVDELKNPEIAKLLGITEKTVRNRKTIALGQMRMKWLGRLGFFW
jgi:RNA polymerase sigma-70 factor (ECF subfamily)